MPPKREKPVAYPVMRKGMLSAYPVYYPRTNHIRYSSLRLVKRQMSRDTKVYRFRRVANFTRIDSTSSGLTDQFGSYQFKLSDVPNVSEFQNLFDMYRIKAIKMVFYPTNTSVSISGGGTAVNIVTPRFISVIDEDDASAPTTQEELFQYQTCKITTVNKKHTIYFKPKVAQEIYNGASTAYAVPSGTPWLNLASTTIQHYGVKWCMESAGSTAPVGAFSYKVNVTYYLEFKSVR